LDCLPQPWAFGYRQGNVIHIPKVTDHACVSIVAQDCQKTARSRSIYSLPLLQLLTKLVLIRRFFTFSVLQWTRRITPSNQCGGLIGKLLEKKARFETTFVVKHARARKSRGERRARRTARINSSSGGRRPETVAAFPWPHRHVLDRALPKIGLGPLGP
jgi:hypothetical protein